MLAVLSFGLTSLLALSHAFPAPHYGFPPSKGHHQPKAQPKAIYMLTNDASNAVAAVPIGGNGMLAIGSVTPTGGNGGNSIDAMGLPAAPDPLLSQSALTIAGSYIFAVNPGSNTLSMLAISPWDPTKLTLVGAPVSVPGEFPNTVAASAKNKLVCVGTTGAVNGLSCSTFSAQGLGPMDALRSFDLIQTTPPVGPLNTVSQLLFSESEDSLFALVKGDPTKNITGFWETFSVQGGNWQSGASLPMTGTKSSPEGTAVLFGSKDIPGTPNVFVTDASFGAAIIAVDPSTGVASTVANQTIDGQKATCWAAISPKTGTGFVTDVGVNRVVEMSLTDASIVAIHDLSSNGDPGLIDLIGAGDFVYALSPGNGTTNAAVSVLDVSGGPGTASQVQHFDLSAMGVDKNAQGMVVA